MSICPRCGVAFECMAAQPTASSEPCWCSQMPSLPVAAYLPDNQDPAASRCLCPYCLRGLLAAQGMLEPLNPR